MITRKQQKAYNAEAYPASVLTWMNEATDRAFNIFEIMKVCKNCRWYGEENKRDVCMENVIEDYNFLDEKYYDITKDFGCNKWEEL